MGLPLLSALSSLVFGRKQRVSEPLTGKKGEGEVGVPGRSRAQISASAGGPRHPRVTLLREELASRPHNFMLSGLSAPLTCGQHIEFANPGHPRCARQPAITLDMVRTVVLSSRRGN